MTQSPASPQPVPCVELRVPAAAVPALEEILAGLAIPFSVSTNADTREAVVWCFGDSPEAVRERCTALAALLAGCRDAVPGPAPEPRVVWLPGEDWSTSWRRSFPVLRVSRRLVLKPSWEVFRPGREDIVLEIDPGMGFGTGYHGTTRACLEFLDELAARLGPVPFLDAGCGSGILALAAVRLGFRPVLAFDHDPEAVRIARGNLAAAGAGEVSVAAADLAEYEPPRRVRVIAANLLAPTLTAHRGRLRSWLDLAAGTGWLILSGILTGEYPGVRDAFLAAGFREAGCRTLDEWTSGCFAADGPGREFSERP